MKECGQLLDESPGIKQLNKSNKGSSRAERLARADDLFNSSPIIVEFMRSHPNLPKELYYRSYGQIVQVINEHKNCSSCVSLSSCNNMQTGHYMTMKTEYDYLDFCMQPCQKNLLHKKQEQSSSLIRSHHVSKEVREATFESLEYDNGRSKAIEAAIDFCSHFIKEIPSKGLYFYGSLGVGKSMIAGSIAKDLVRYGIDSYMIYVPEFMREIKNAIQEGSVDKKIESIKKSTVLILDDIGAEAVTPWTRDEVLGAILQYRANERLPVVYTSNLDLNELENHLSYAQKGGAERVKAKRILERIKHFVIPISVEGRNRRL